MSGRFSDRFIKDMYENPDNEDCCIYYHHDGTLFWRDGWDGIWFYLDDECALRFLRPPNGYKSRNWRRKNRKRSK